MFTKNYSYVPSFAPLDMAGSPRMTAARCCLSECIFDSLLGMQRLGLTEITQSTAPWPTQSVQQTMSQNSTDTGRTGSRFPWCLCFSHCSKDTFATGDFESFAFSKKLLQQKMDLLLEGAHLTDGAWPVEVFP